MSFRQLAFSSVAGPVVSVRAFLITIAWIWLHLLQCNTSNQYKSTDEDALNKPWRPLPSGRISPQSTRLLRWSLAVLCPCISYFHSPALSMASLVLTFTTIIYDEACLADHWIGKNACGVAGYTSFQAGASMIMGRCSHAFMPFNIADHERSGMTSDLDLIAIRSLMCSAIVIFTTLHVQDFADVIGDKATGRVTFPILFPQASRVCAVSAILRASTTLPAYWGLPLIPKVTLAVLSLVIAFRLFVHRSQASDRLTYVIYNVSLSDLAGTFLVRHTSC
jgi:4-hydroxybenzoate polyprenyltransferase